MSGIFERLRVLYLTHFSQPTADRLLYRDIRQRRVRKIMEIGIGDGSRTARMIELARRLSPPEGVHYTGIDLFESRTNRDRPGLSLKDAHRRFKSTGVRVQLLPGNPLTTLSRVANSLNGIELVIVGADWDAKLMARAWFYLPRMLARSAAVYLQEPGEGENEGSYRLLKPAEVAELAEPMPRRRAA